MALTKDERKKIITRLWMLAGITGRTDITWETMAEMTDAEVEDVGALIEAHPTARIFADVERDQDAAEARRKRSSSVRDPR